MSITEIEDPATPEPGSSTAAGAGVCCADVWRALERASFAVIGHVTPAGEPRSSGVVYGVADRRLYVVVAADSLKARQIETGSTVSVTVPVRRGGVLALLFPIPPATISFEAYAVVHPGTDEGPALPPQLARLLPDERRSTATVIELRPIGRFLTYGIGVSLADMRRPELSRARVPVA